jgi:hypothetical protein
MVRREYVYIGMVLVLVVILAIIFYTVNRLGTESSGNNGSTFDVLDKGVGEEDKDRELEVIDLSGGDEMSLWCMTSVCLGRGCFVSSLEEFEDEVNRKDLGSCDDFVFPKIDFSKNDLLGKDMMASGCSRDYFRDVVLDVSEKIVRYNIEVNEVGSCEPAVNNPNWILVEKIPNGYRVEYSSEVS